MERFYTREIIQRSWQIHRKPTEKRQKTPEIAKKDPLKKKKSGEFGEKRT